MLSPAPQAATATVLVVDDEPFNVDLLSQELDDLGHATVPAEDGRAALERIAAGGIDLVLLDIMMPQMDGFQVLERLRIDGRLAELPVIVVSALSEVGSVARCLELGAEDHLVKPFDPVLLRARIGGALEKKGLRDQLARQLSLTRALFGRYVPEAVAEKILSGGGSLEPVQRTATVLCCDIEGFTAIVEAMAPGEAMALLNDYYQAVIEPVRRCGGVVNEFIGDGMLVTFNVPVVDDGHADRAVAAAIGIHEALDGRRFQGRRLAARIGIHTGPVIAGNVTAGDRLHYTVLGDTVNVAARLEQANKDYGTSLLISGATVRMMQGDQQLERLDDANLRGKRDSIPVFGRAQDPLPG